MFILLSGIAATAAFGALAARYGAEQRPGFDGRRELRGPSRHGLR